MTCSGHSHQRQVRLAPKSPGPQRAGMPASLLKASWSLMEALELVVLTYGVFLPSDVRAAGSLQPP